MTRLAAWSQRHHWTAIGLWLVALVAITVGSTVAGNDYRNDFSLPGTESQELIDAYAEHAPEQEGDPVTVVVQAEAGVDAVTDEVDALVDDLSGLDHVAAVQPPDPRSGTVSDDGTLGLHHGGARRPDRVRADRRQEGDHRHRPGPRGATACGSS